MFPVRTFTFEGMAGGELFPRLFLRRQIRTPISTIATIATTRPIIHPVEEPVVVLTEEVFDVAELIGMGLQTYH